MAVTGERVERGVRDDSDLGHRLLDRAGDAVDQIVRVENVRAGLVAKRDVDIGEYGERGNAELRGTPGLLDGDVDRIAFDAGHRGEGIAALFAIDHEDRPDQVVDRQARFLHHAPRPVRLAHPPQTPAAGDFVDRAQGGGNRAGDLVHDGVS